MTIKVCLRFALFLLSSPVSSAPTSSTCCTEKKVGEILYTLVGKNKESTTFKFGCKDGCVYTADQAGEYKFCFKEGLLPVACLKFEWGNEGEEVNYDYEDDSHVWGYEGDLGPSHWAELDVKFKECNGTNQSPININSTDSILRNQTTPLIFNNYHKIGGGMFGNTGEHYGEPVKDSRLNLTNRNGHTAELHVIETLPEHVGVLRGGPLGGYYQIIQLHFHWGSDDTNGSEHTLDGKRFPMEMHIVHKKMGVTISEAKNMKGGFAVAGFFFEVVPNNNTAIEPLITVLKDITHPNASVNLSGSPFMITDLLSGVAPIASGETFTYSSYNGSLTTPACQEVVHWINFINQTYINISSYQLSMFRTLKNGTNQDLVKNVRPLQLLNGRNVSIYGA